MTAAMGERKMIVYLTQARLGVDVLPRSKGEVVSDCEDGGRGRKLLSCGL